MDLPEVQAWSGNHGNAELRKAFAISAKESRMIHVIAVVTAKPGRRTELIKELESNLPLQRAEQGFIEVNLTVDVDGTRDRFGDDVFVMIEKWESRETFEAHLATPHLRSYNEQIKDRVANVAIHVLGEQNGK
jgi:quinol monooxygenase YgiN